MTIKEGQPAPDFTAPATSDTTITLSALKGKKVVLYFYPKHSTPGCTTEGQNFRDLYPNFQEANCEILGVSKDSLRRHENFKAKQEFPFELISDEDETVCRLFDVIKLKKMYGKEFEGIERSTFLIDEDGVVRDIWRKVKVKGHAEDVLDAVHGL